MGWLGRLKRVLVAEVLIIIRIVSPEQMGLMVKYPVVVVGVGAGSKQREMGLEDV